MLRTRSICHVLSMMCLLLASSLLAAESPNLVNNAACEQAAEDGTPAGWTYSFSSGGTCDFVLDTEVRHAGSASIRLSNHQGGAKYPRIFQPVQLVGDTQYKLTAYVHSTVGIASMNITPGEATWFGDKTISDPAYIFAGQQWRQIEIAFTTKPSGEPVKANIVFTLSTAEREAAELWIDDVSLVAQAIEPDKWALFTPPPDASVVLPHVAWAKPLAGPRRRVLFMAPSITIRDVMELSHRMDVDAEIRYAPKGEPGESNELLELFAEPWDAIVFGSVNWERFSQPVRDAIWEKVRAGTGLFMVNPLGDDESLKLVLDAMEPSSSRSFFSEQTQLDLPYLDWVRDGAGLRSGTLGEGRVAVIDYGMGDQSKWGETICSLFPPHDGRIPRADEMVWWEPCFAMLSSATYWVAGGEPCEITDVAVRDVGRDSVVVDVQVGGALPGAGAVVDAICIGPGNRHVAQTVATIAGDKAAIAIEAPLLTGEHFIWLQVRDANGAASGWASHLFVAPGPTATVTTEQDRYEQGDTVRGSVHIDGDHGADQIEITLVDGYGRVVDRQLVQAANIMAFSLDSRDVRTLTARVIAKLVDGDRVACESYAVIPVVRELDDKDYLVGIWASYFPLTCARPWSHYLVKFQRDMGIDAAFMAHSPEPMYHQTYAEHNMVPMPESMSRIWFKQQEPYISLDLTDPAFMPAFRRTIREHAETGYRWGAFDFSVGDECGYALRYNDTTYTAFREWLRPRYADLADLNRQWGTDFATWDDVQPTKRADLDPAVSLAPHVEFCTFSDQLFADAFRIARDEVRDIDPRNRLGMTGTRDPGHYIGFDWYRLMNTIDHLAFYDGIQREAVRSFMKPGDVITSFVGFDFLDLDERNTRYFPWLELFNGFQGISIYSASSGDWHGYIRHDLSWTRRARWTHEELGELKTGVARAILTATREPTPIAVLYSQPSLHSVGTTRWQDNVTGLCETIKDLGLQFDFVADEQLAAGVLSQRGYKVLFLPLATALSDEDAAIIEAFALDGGRVISVGEVGVFNQYGATRASGVLDKLFGISAASNENLPAITTADLFGVTLDVTPCAVNIEQGIGAFDNLPLLPCARRKVGRGEAIFLNFLWSGYRSIRSGGVGGEISERVSADAETAGAFWHVLEELLAGYDIQPPAAITHEGKPFRYVEQVVYRRGPITYVGLLPRYFGGRYAQTAERILIEPDDYSDVNIAFGDSGYIYDMRAREGIGRVSSVEAQVTDGVALLYAATPYEVKGITLSAPTTARPGDTLGVAVTVNTSVTKPGDHVVHIRLIQPDGVESPGAHANLLTDAGHGAWRPRLELNATPGTWRVEAQDIISGHTAVAEIRVNLR
jgi:hypothetical protein